MIAIPTLAAPATIRPMTSRFIWGAGYSGSARLRSQRFRTTPERIRCGWSPNGTFAISFFVRKSITDIESVPDQLT